MTAHVVLQGTAAINLSTLDPQEAASFREQLTLQQRTFDGTFHAVPYYYDYGDGWLHVPIGWLLNRADLLPGMHIEDKRSDGKALPAGTCAHVQFGVDPFPSEQPKAIEDAVANTQRNTLGGLFLAPTRAGKSLMSLETACRLGGSTLILVDDIDLARQFQRDIEEHLRMPCGIVRQQEADWDKPFVIAMAQTIIRREIPLEVARAFRTIIVDECNSAPCSLTWTALSRFHARYTIGLTATPDRKDGLEQAIRWIIGPDVIANCHRKLEADVHWLPVRWTYEGRLNRPDPIKAEKIVMEDWSRINLLANEAVKGVKAGRRVLMMCNLRAHVDRLTEAVRELGVEVGQYVSGSSPADMRHPVCIATYKKAARGLDYKPPATLFIPAGPVSDIRQAVGRALQPQVPHRTLILDPVDLQSGLMRWANNRARYYSSRGFVYRNQLPDKRWVA